MTALSVSLSREELLVLAEACHLSADRDDTLARSAVMADGYRNRARERAILCRRLEERLYGLWERA